MSEMYRLFLQCCTCLFNKDLYFLNIILSADHPFFSSWCYIPFGRGLELSRSSWHVLPWEATQLLSPCISPQSRQNDTKRSLLNPPFERKHQSLHPNFPYIGLVYTHLHCSAYTQQPHNAILLQNNSSIPSTQMLVTQCRKLSRRMNSYLRHLFILCFNTPKRAVHKNMYKGNNTTNKKYK